MSAPLAISRSGFECCGTVGSAASGDATLAGAAIDGSKKAWPGDHFLFRDLTSLNLGLGGEGGDLIQCAS